MIKKPKAGRLNIGFNYQPLVGQLKFHNSGHRFRLYAGGMGCVGGETMIDGVPIKDYLGGKVDTLFGKCESTRSYEKGVANLYRVSTRLGRSVVVTLHHRFLTPSGWNQLQSLCVGGLIGVHDDLHDVSDRGKGLDSQDYYYGDFRQYGELPSPLEVAYLSKLRQFHKTVCDSSALDYIPYHVCKKSSFDRLGLPIHEDGGLCYCEEDGGESVHQTSFRLDQSSLQSSYKNIPDYIGQLFEYQGALTSSCGQQYPVSSQVLPLREVCVSPEFANTPFYQQLKKNFEVPDIDEQYIDNQSFFLSHHNIGIWDEITKIEFVRNDIFYDISVPDAEHYLAEGIYHHNSGKTLAGVFEVLKLALKYAGNFILVGRATYPELRDTTWKELLNQPLLMVNKQPCNLQDSGLIRSYNKANHEIVLVNGSTIIGRALDDAMDKLGKGLNLGAIYVDELTEIAEEVWLSMTVGRLRLKLPCSKCKVMPAGDSVKCPKCGKVTIFHTAFGTTNPEGHDWVWKRFVAKPDEEYFFVQANTRDNPHLPKDYVKNLESQFPEEWVKRYVDGSFDTFEGLVYKDYVDKEPYVVNKFDIPEHWYRFIGLDHGYRNPTAILWGAVDTEGNVYIYDEYYEKGKVVSQISEVIKAKNSDTKIWTMLIDPATRQNKGLNGEKTIFGEFQEHGLYFELANNQVSQGINRVQEYFKVGENGKPKLRIFRNCFNLRTELQTYRYKDLKPNAVSENGREKPVKKDDHLVDALRYMINYVCDTPLRRSVQKSYKDYLFERRGTQLTDWRAA